MNIKRALISCTDKTGVVDFAKFLSGQGIQILSTGGTAKLIREAGIEVVEVSDFTGSPEILDGRLKTLHPKIHGGILGIRDNAGHQKQMQDNGIEPIDLVVVNLYAFENTVAKEGVTLAEAVENIDIGGPTMLRAAAKNYKHCAVVVDPSDYAVIQKEIQDSQSLSESLCYELARKVFEHTAHYDSVIVDYLNKNSENEVDLTSKKTIALSKIQDLRYGENPHQKAAFYQVPGEGHGVVQAKQLQGKELSFNNILDLEAAYQCCKDFTEPACVIVKHLNPCGVAVSQGLSEAFIKARSGDPVSSFGGIVALNQEVDHKTALILSETFFEAIIAPSFDAKALEVLQNKKNLRLMVLEDFFAVQPAQDFRRVSGGLLVQDQDNAHVDLSQCEVVTKREPSAEEFANLSFAWKVVKHVKSNAIVYAKDGQVLGVGAGQMSRVDSVKIAAIKASESFAGQDVLSGAVMASDAFFPFRDGVDMAVRHGITAVVQPGGSVRDQEVIAACDEAGVAMVVTKMRHFKH